MEKIIVDKPTKIVKNKKRLEQVLEIKITNRGREIFVSGDAKDEYIAEKVIEAIDFGFPLSHASLIKKHDFLFEIINIKSQTKRKDYQRIKARIIGKKGKTLKTLSNLTACYFEIKDNFVGIIGGPEYIKNAEEAIISLIHGSKQSNVYSHLEKHQIRPIVDLGLKPMKKKRKE